MTPILNENLSIHSIHLELKKDPFPSNLCSHIRSKMDPSCPPPPPGRWDISILHVQSKIIMISIFHVTSRMHLYQMLILGKAICIPLRYRYRYIIYIYIYVCVRLCVCVSVSVSVYMRLCVCVPSKFNGHFNAMGNGHLQRTRTIGIGQW